jgi:hypothetical protein
MRDGRAVVRVCSRESGGIQCCRSYPKNNIKRLGIESLNLRVAENDAIEGTMR